LTPKNFSFYSEEIQCVIKKLKPGLTGIGSIVFRDEEAILANSSKKPIECYKEDISPYKGELEMWFNRNQSVYLYFILIFLTVNSIFFPTSKLAFKIFKDLPRPNNDLFDLIK
jgi:lipopolysaccharide/colanic/teichoic acid biosynthesis glycosyltransferase